MLAHRSCSAALLVAALTSSAVGIGGSGGAAEAKPIVYVVDPAQSRVTVGPASVLQADLGALGTASLPLASEVGAIDGAAGFPLAGIGVSDGLVTSLVGRILADRKDGSIRIDRSGTTLALVESGSWAPDPSATGVPAPAQLAASIVGGATGLQGTAALRAAVFSLETPKRTLVPGAGSAFEFPGVATIHAEGGGFDHSLSSFSAPGRGSLDQQMTIAVAPGTARLEPLANGGERLVLPIAWTVALDEGSFGTGLGLSATLVLQGEIVAVPEPSLSSGVVGVAGLALALAARRRARS